MIDYDLIDTRLLPDETVVSSVTIAEMSVGPPMAADELERAQRQLRLQWALAGWNPVPFDVAAAQAFGLVYVATSSAGRSPRTRIADLMIAATALANGFSLYTRNHADFAHLDHLLEVVVV